MSILDLQCWEKTEAVVSGLNYFEQKFRAIIFVEGKQYPCWIGIKSNRHGGAILIVAKGDEKPEGRSPDTKLVSAGQTDDYVCYQFENNGPQHNEGYGEMRRYLWNKKDDKASIIILGTLPNITAENITKELNNLGTFAVSEKDNQKNS